MRGCLMLIAWTPLSLLIAGPFLEYEDPAYRGGDPSAPEPSLMFTREELLVLAVWGLFWLAGIAIILVFDHLWRAMRGVSDIDGPAAVVVALAWGLVVTWLAIGIEPLLFPDRQHILHNRLWSWSLDGPVELLILPSLAALLWAGGLAAMALTARVVWRMLPATQ